MVNNQFPSRTFGRGRRRLKQKEEEKRQRQWARYVRAILAGRVPKASSE